MWPTVVTSSLATIAMGIFSNLPLAVGPGIEVSAFFTYILVNRMGMTWEEALLAVCVSGALNIVLTAFSVRQRIVEAIPKGLKSSLLLAIGVFVLLVGLKLGDVIDVDTRTRWLFLSGPFWSIDRLRQGPLVLLVGLVFSAVLNIARLRLPWGTLIGILAGALACHIVGIELPSYQTFGGDKWYQTVLKLSPAAVFTLPFLSGVIILFVIDFVGGIGKIYALTEDAGIARENARGQGLRNALYVDGAATLLGGLLGTSSLIAFVESRIGIQAGGRTGLAAIICGCLMLLGGTFSKLLVLVPPPAAADTLVYVGLLLIGLNGKIVRRESDRALDRAVAIAMGVSVLLSFQMDYAMLLGFGTYYCLARKRGESLQSTFWLGLVALLLLVTIIPQLILLAK